ncbi:MAG: mannose-1-phosphate guanylyltransferase/mannose-6-phosphate isomerase, partial [Xanthomonadaceae bacterium]|nr:mannose-1-phosphate guanylyltransferase/mannose-6-phosphate isomerase [Xanthomonadaceae bacterium]
MNDLLPVILSGGSGTRLWPLSREAYPKQFLPLVGDDTMLQATWRRVVPLNARKPIVVVNQEHRFIVAEQLREIGVEPAAVILEPVGRNTAPAIALAALQATCNGDDPFLLVLPSDHVIRDEKAFQTAVIEAAKVAETGKLVTFGVVPTGPETGYGYIKAVSRQGTSEVERFVEKPDLKTAEQYVASGGYYWNSGMFLFKASRYLEELERYQPVILESCRKALELSVRDYDFIRIDTESFGACPSDSIDYAVMEKTDSAAVVPLNAGWSDVGSWSALWEVSSQDNAGNACHGDVVSLDCRNTYAYGQRLIAMIGLENMVVVETDDAILVGHRDRIQEVKDIVATVKREGRTQATWHRKVYRPWGAYDSIDQGDRFQVKRITVKPGATLSLQMHHHRAEHWVVVRGTARVTRGEEE